MGGGTSPSSEACPSNLLEASCCSTGPPPGAAAIDAGDYARAWELATVNRLDLNVLVDYKWPLFLERAAQFAAQVRRCVECQL